MTLKEARQSGQPYKRPSWSFWATKIYDEASRILVTGDYFEPFIALSLIDIDANDYILKSEPNIVWHIVLHEINDSFKKTLITCENEEHARYEAQRYAKSGVWVVSLYKSFEADEKFEKVSLPREFWVKEFKDYDGYTWISSKDVIEAHSKTFMQINTFKVCER